MKTERYPLAHLACALVLAVAGVLPAQAQDNPCLLCHAALVDKKVVHAAVQIGCTSCHTDLDTSAMPHKVKGKIAKGLSAEPPALCTNCHDKKLFQGKLVHVPAAAGMCLGCHNPHASDNIGLLKKDPATLCLECHPDIKTKAHGGFSRGQHPLGFESKEREDPLRKGKKFYCAACHEPHRSERPKLNRFAKGMAACQQCHKM